MRIFLSSSYQDLVEEREAVYARLSSDHDVVRMEDFGSRDEVPIETCLEAEEGCEAYVLLLGHRYGSLAPEYGLSYTQVEYDQARQLRLPVLSYIRDGIDGAIPEADDPLRLGDFKAEIEESHTVRRPYFTSPESLAHHVYDDVVALQSRLTTRPTFPKRSAPIQDSLSYGIRTVRHTRVLMNPLVAFVVDLSALSLARYPPTTRGRQLARKVVEVHGFLRREHVNALIFNQIPATGDTSIVDQRVEEMSRSAQIVVCFLRGPPDLEHLPLFVDLPARISLWYPRRLTITNPPNVRGEAYAPDDLPSCELALHVQEYLDGVIDEHVGASLA